VIDLDRVCKHYQSPGETIRAVEDASFQVAPREFVSVMGPSGSGKTTLLLLVGGLLRPDAGTVRFEGRDLGSLSRRESLAYRRTKLGFVFQDFRLSDGLSAEENVAVPLLMRGTARRDAQRRALEVLEAVDLLHRASHTPERLSGGERQRVAIARALVGEPGLLLADEPTGNLDSETSLAMLTLLSTVPRQRGAAVILVTHDGRLASEADRQLEMRDGRVSEHAAAHDPLLN
jgi:putative ABC transport system ATP-binding protein